MNGFAEAFFSPLDPYYLITNIASPIAHPLKEYWIVTDITLVTDSIV
jgi:hypothetical protein